MELWSLRVLHIVSGTLLVGGSAFVAFYLLPAVGQAGPAGGAVMAGLTRRRVPLYFNVLSAVTVLTGLRLYMLVAVDGWLLTGPGLFLTAGAVFGLSAFVAGLFVQRPLAMKLGALAAAVDAQGAPPNDAQARDLQTLGARLGKVARHNAALLVVTALSMAAARFAPF